MNKASRKSAAKSKPVRHHSPAFIGSTWVGSLISVAVLLFAGNAVVSDFASFRSCNSNASGLVVNNCGKQSINLGDAVLVGLFVLTAGLVVGLVTAAWRATSRRV